MKVNNIQEKLVYIFFGLIPLDYLIFGCLFRNVPLVGYWNDILLIVLSLFCFCNIQKNRLPLNLIEYSFIIIISLLFIDILVKGEIIKSMYMLRIYLVPMLYYFVMRRIGLTERKFSNLLNMIIIIAALISIYGIFQAFVLGDSFLNALQYREGGLTDAFYLHLSDIQRVTGTFVAPNTCSMYLIFVFIISVCMKKYLSLNKFILIISQFLIFCAIVTTFSRTGWIALFICAMVISIQYIIENISIFKSQFKKNYKKILFLILLIIIFICICDFIFFGGDITATMYSLIVNTITLNDTSLNAHIDSIITSFQDSFKYFFGFGLYGVGPKSAVVSNIDFIKLPESSFFVIILSVGLVIGILWILSYIFFYIDSMRLKKNNRQTIILLITALLVFYTSLPVIQEVDVMSFLFAFIGLISSDFYLSNSKKVLILTKHDISSAYSCLIYLKEALLNNKIDVDLWSWTELENKQRLLKVDPTSKSFLFCWYRYLPKVRFIFAILHSFLMAYCTNAKVIINDIEFFAPFYYYKKLLSATIIHYCTEIYGEDIQTKQFYLKFYKKHADYPDMIIECLNERAEYRKLEYQIKQKIYVIDNTIPLQNIQSVDLIDTYLSDINPHQYPVVLYAGAAYLNRDIGKFLKGLDNAKNNVCFIGFCYGSTEDLQILNNFCKENLSMPYLINAAIPRNELMKIMGGADIGIVYYDPNISINYKYASPTKFFEYMSRGLNILCSNNVGINEIVKSNNIGVCIEEDSVEGIANAYDKLIEQGLLSSENIKSIFKEKYCYQIDAKETIEKIIELINFEERRISY